jgi:MiaB-like tRNA modifying enzyme
MAKIYSEVYGCSSNKADCEIALGLLEKAGFEVVDDAARSDVVAIFTCTVKSPTVNRMVHRIRELTKLGKPLVVAGCMPKTEKKVIEKINSNASMVGPNSIEKIVDIVRMTIEGKKAVFTEDLRKPKLCLPRVRMNPVIGIVPISAGCRNDCSYCSVKFARGGLFSYPVQEIAEEVRRALRDGCREFYITSQDCASYGFDSHARLHGLLDEVCRVEGRFFVRVGMMNPMHVRQIMDELIEAYGNEKVFKFLHLPVQSGSDRILSLMKRGYEVKDFIEIVEKFRKRFSSITLATDVIVGFPSETEEDFKKTVELVENVKPDITNISKFGPRSGTEAAKMEQLDRKIVNERSSMLHKIVKRIALEKNRRWVGWEGEILVDEVGPNKTFVGRNFAYKPVVLKESCTLGSLVDVKIVDATSNFLAGKLI